MKAVYIKPETEVILMEPLMDNPTASLGDGGEVEEFDAKRGFDDMEEIDYDMWK